MSNGADNYKLYLQIDQSEDDEELEKQRLILREQLYQLEGVEKIDQISVGDIPEGARAVDLVVIGGLAIALKKSGVFDAMVAVLKTWIERGNQRKEKRKVIIKRPDKTVVCTSPEKTDTKNAWFC